jgi:hypothetical protein
VRTGCKVHVVRGVRYTLCKVRTHVHGSINILGPPRWLLPDSDERRRYPKYLHPNEIWIVRVSGNAVWTYKRPQYLPGSDE